MSDKTTYESLDNRIAPEALTKDHTKGLAVVDGHAVKSQEDYEDPDRLYGMLIARIRKYHPSTDVSLIEKAYKLAVEAHGDQRRKSGEPYIIHPLWVARYKVYGRRYPKGIRSRSSTSGRWSYQAGKTFLFFG